MSERSFVPHHDRAEAYWGESSSITRRIADHHAMHGHPPTVVGKAPAPGDILLSGNDYLDLASDERIIGEQARALENVGNEIYMSGVYVQYLGQQREFELDVAAFLGSEDAVLCQSGYAANEGLIQTLADESTPVYIDMQAHASLWQGAQTAGATAYPFRHNNAEHLQTLIRRYGPGVVAVDAIYSTLGSILDVAGFVDVCERNECLLVVDESHAVGVVGEQGEGVISAAGYAHRVPYRTFSLSKALVGRAGMILGPTRVADFFRFESRPAIFSSAVMPWEIVRFRKTLEIARSANDRRQRIVDLSDRLRSALDSLGYNVDTSQSAIIPLEAGPEEKTRVLREALEDRGVFGAVFCSPATPLNRSIVRFCVHAGMTDDHIDRVIAVCDEIRDVVDMENWSSTRRKRQRDASPVALSVARDAVSLPIASD